MTFEERVERAWDIINDSDCIGAERSRVEAAIRAAFPDLYGEKPTAWIAPWEASEEMREAGSGPVDRDWRTMRDLYLKQSS